MTIGFDGRVAVITGAGLGLGRSYARLLAQRGAKVVVNDVGGAVDGTGGDSATADAVVKEIAAAGGTAIANYEDVSDPAAAKRLIDAAVAAYGKVDILINNAGILRDKSFGKVPLEDFARVVQVHLLGTAYCTHAAWPLMNAQKYGRVVVTTSVAGTNGNFGQTNYGAAKMGLLGLMNCLAVEGARNNVLVNAISPAALTRMTENLVSEKVAAVLKPEFVAPMVAYLCSEACRDTATVLQAQGAGYSRIAYFETAGVQFDPGQPVTPEMVAEAFPQLTDLATATPVEPGIAGRMEQRLKAIGYW